MKNYEAMTHDVFRRMDEYEIAQKKKRKTIARMGTSVCGVCLMALMGITLWRGGMRTTSPITPDNSSTVSNHHGEGDPQTPSHQGGEQSDPPANSQGDHPSDPAVTDPPVTSQTPSHPGSGNDHPDRKWTMNVNHISSSISGAKKYYDPELYYHETWNMEKMTGYLGVDLSAVGGLTYTGGDRFTVTMANDGAVAYDTAVYRYGSNVVILASKLGAPEDCVYTLDKNDKTVFKPDNGITVSTIIGARPDGLFFADYEYKGIYYRITATNSSEKEFADIVSAVIQQSTK